MSDPLFRTFQDGGPAEAPQDSTIRVATFNIRSIANKRQFVRPLLDQHNLDVLVLTETKLLEHQ